VWRDGLGSRGESSAAGSVRLARLARLRGARRGRDRLAWPQERRAACTGNGAQPVRRGVLGRLGELRAACVGRGAQQAQRGVLGWLGERRAAGSARWARRGGGAGVGG